MKSITTWLLGGALLASLSWNWKLAEAGTAPTAAPAAVCGTEASCTLDLACAELAPGQEERLAAVCARSCAESDALERRADALQGELIAGLSAEEIDRAATTRLIAEVAELRRQSLAACVEGILGVREVLSAGEVRALLERCGHAPGATSCK
jgi:Heavy-metal resistance